MAAPRRSGVATSSHINGYLDVSEMEKYKLVSNIGKGSFGVISKVQRVDDGREFALKQIDYSKMTEKDRKQIAAEVAILESLKHRNIVQLVQKIKDPKNECIYIVMEYCTSGDLGSLIRKAKRNNQPLHEDKIWNIFLQITQALHHCHWPSDRPVAGRPVSRVAQSNVEVPRYQVLHRDLKPENGESTPENALTSVFLSDDFVKLGDFGLSKDMGTSAFTSTYVGTPLYMPPEILAENRYDTKSDIWSLGCLVFEMCALSSPFSAATTQAELITMVKSGRIPALPAHISPGLKNVIKAMLNLNPVKRPTTKDLLDMDEMKLHRKLFTVQNQASLLMTKKEEIKQLEERLATRLAALEEREQALLARELGLEVREAACLGKEDENRETQRRLNAAAEQLRGHWDKLRGKEEPVKPSRPPLEERNTVPLVRTYTETPSKIPLASADRPLRRNNTKSLGSLNSAYKEAEVEVTPKKVPGKRTSIGSPSELNWCEDVSMASPSYSSFASPAPFVPRPRMSSIVQTSNSTESISSGSMSTASSTESLDPPSKIPAPVFVYREAATPAKWALEDPDLPSPFLRRQSVPQPIIPERQPLGSINAPQKKAPVPIPRSKSGNLHQHVLKSNAARTSNEGVKKIVRVK